MYQFDPYNVLLGIATNISVLLMTASVLQGHICGPNMNDFSNHQIPLSSGVI